MRTETIGNILETQNIEKVCLPKEKTKYFEQWRGYLDAKIKELRLG